MTLVVAFAEVSPAAPLPAPAQPEGRCPQCRKLLFRGVLTGEIQCGRCGMLVKFGERVQ